MKILGQREWASQVYYFSFSTSKRGVAILIIKNTLLHYILKVKMVHMFL